MKKIAFIMFAACMCMFFIAYNANADDIKFCTLQYNLEISVNKGEEAFFAAYSQLRSRMQSDEYLEVGHSWALSDNSVGQNEYINDDKGSYWKYPSSAIIAYLPMNRRGAMLVYEYLRDAQKYVDAIKKVYNRYRGPLTVTLFVDNKWNKPGVYRHGDEIVVSVSSSITDYRGLKKIIFQSIKDFHAMKKFGDED